MPSNLALEKFGASRWIARIMVSWGIISALMAIVSGAWSFYMLRFLLGVAEAGFFPGIILYLTYWFPAEYRARFLAAFAIAVPVSTVIGAPISGLLLGLDGVDGPEGLAVVVHHRRHPSVLLGVVTWFYLTDKPEKADWLTPDQKAWLSDKLEASVSAKESGHGMTLGQALSSPKVIDAERDLFRLRRRALRHAVLAAADREGVRLHQRCRPVSSPRSPICSAPLPWCCGRSIPTRPANASGMSACRCC